MPDAWGSGYHESGSGGQQLGRVCGNSGRFLVLIGIPVSMWLDGKQRAKKDLSFFEKVSYTLEESGISAKSSQGERKVGWQEIQKVTATGQQVILLFGKRRVILLPKKQMGVKYIPALQIISAYTAPEKVKIRGI